MLLHSIKAVMRLVLSGLLFTASPLLPATDGNVTAPTGPLVVLLYHHVADDTPAVTSTPVAQFTAHLQYLSEHRFNVIALPEALAKLNQGESLPPKSVAITFDDGYQSIYDNAWPLLKQHQFPFTIFVTTEPIERRYSAMMTWQQLQEMQQQGVTLANHSVSHPHMIALTKDEFQTEVERAQAILQQKLSSTPAKLFAYPFGEYTKAQAQWLAEAGYHAFAQHSGPLSAASAPQGLPRFSLSGRYASLESLTLRLNTAAMPVLNQADYDPFHPRAPKQLEFDLKNPPFAMTQLNCFYQGKPIEQVTFAPKTPTSSIMRVTITLPSTPAAGRSRVNCTAPTTRQGHYYWHSIPMFVGPATQQWPD